MFEAIRMLRLFLFWFFISEESEVSLYMRRISERNVFPNFDLREEYEKIKDTLRSTSIHEKTVFDCMNVVDRRITGNRSVCDLLSYHYFELGAAFCGTFTSFDEMYNNFHLDEVIISEENILEFLQFAINCVIRVKALVQVNNHYKEQPNYLKGIISYMESLSSKLGTEITQDNETDEYFLQYKEDLAVVVSTQHPDLRESLNEYLRIDNRNNLKRKREILSTLFRRLESIESKLKGTEFNSLISDTKGFMNATRHVENDKSAFAKEFASLNDTEKENWCDESYSLFVSCMAVLPYIEFKPNITKIKQQTK